jgi:hypothetical protein
MARTANAWTTLSKYSAGQRTSSPGNASRAAAPLARRCRRKRCGTLRSRQARTSCGRGLLRANVGALFFVGLFVAFHLIVVLYLQELRGWSVLETGMALLIASMDAVLAPMVTPWFVRRYRNARGVLATKLAALSEAPATPELVGSAGPVPPTSRERDIALLGADGLPSRVISERLYVSVRTVDTSPGSTPSSASPAAPPRPLSSMNRLLNPPQLTLT